MSSKPLSKSRMRSDFSFCFPYLASLEVLGVEEVERYSPEKKRLRCFSACKESHKTLIKVYGSKEFSKKYMNKVQVSSQGYSTVPRSLQKNINKSYNKYRRNSSLHKKQVEFKDLPSKEHTFKNNGSLVQAKTLSIKSKEKYIYQDNTLATQPLPRPVLSHYEIPGVKFKCKMDSMSPEKGQNLSVQGDEIRQKLLRGSKQELWQKQRRLNIDSIINWKCKQFQAVMDQYYKRTQKQPPKLTFLFDSQDIWMKNVLLKKGWVQNKNKHSKAFHLLWTYKFPTEKPFPQQWVNHYPTSYKITTKAGLHQLLQIYQIDYLQPQTYDLDRQSNQFMSECLGTLQKTYQISTDFQQGELLAEIQLYTKKRLEEMSEGLSCQLLYLLHKCHQLLISKDFKIQANRLKQIESTLQAKYQKISEVNDKMITTLTKFWCFMKTKGLIQHSQEGGVQNLWIIKSKTSSKGAGTFISNSLNTLIKPTNRIAQKYIENILLLKSNDRRKFDIRLWVLLSGSRPAKMYYYKDFYCRVCYEPYSLAKQSYKNDKVHLTNYSVNRQSYKPTDYPSVLFPDQIFKEINLKFNLKYETIFYEKLVSMLKLMKPMFLGQLCKGVSSNYFQLFGVDLMIDCKLDLHLLEINMSAKCEERHERLSSMLESMGQGLLNILENKSNIGQWIPII